ncbi:MAG: hypothetical protein H7Y61_04480 [Rhizobiales bacterium]|nr:hypothetical protein [Rhizobacter sp.]
MRRLLAILLLMFLPLQFGWAAVEPYCVDDVRAEVEHAVHNAHPQHADAASATDADGAGLAAKTDCNDCADCHCHCHGHCTGILCSACVVTDRPPTVAPSAVLHAPGRAHAQTRPERPQWARFA